MNYRSENSTPRKFSLHFRTCLGNRTWTTTEGVNREPNYECSAWGQDHFKTFDGHIFKFNGRKCEYILMRHDDVVVTVANKRCINTFDMYMCKEVKIDLVKQKYTITLFQTKYVVENTATQETEIESAYDDPCADIVSGVMLQYKGVFVIVNLHKYKFEIKYDKGSRVYIKANNEHMTAAGNLRGLCGDFDGRTSEDDFVLPDNSLTQSVTEFADGWTAGSSCINADITDACSKNPDLSEWAQKGMDAEKYAL